MRFHKKNLVRDLKVRRRFRVKHLGLQKKLVKQSLRNIIFPEGSLIFRFKTKGNDMLMLKIVGDSGVATGDALKMKCAGVCSKVR